MEAGNLQRPEVLIVGTGAVACLFAARLSAGGVPVVLLGSWPSGLQALSQTGVRLLEADGKEMVQPVRALKTLSECQGVRNALVLVKSWQTEIVAKQLVRCLAPDGLALTLQNGFGNYNVLVQALGSRRVAQGALTLGATLIAPGIVRSAGGGMITLGLHPHLQEMTNLLGRAGMVVETVSDFLSVQWGRQVINSAIHPITAILGVANGELLQRPSARNLLQTAAREAAGVAVARGVHLPYPDPVVACEAIARQTATNFSPMLQDVRRGAPTEIEYINGTVVREGEKTGVPTPVNKALMLLVKALKPGG